MTYEPGMAAILVEIVQWVRTEALAQGTGAT